jgi:hypothetical protein
MTPTIESILAQCEEVGDCLEWQGRMQNGSPQVYVGRVNGKSRYRTARRVFTELLVCGPIHPFMRCTTTCGNERCLAQEHLKMRTYKQMARINAKRGLQSTPHARAAIARGRRNRSDVKLSLEKAREIRQSPLTGVQLAAVYGVNRTLIGAIRRNEIWRESLPGASVFALGGL